MVQMEIQGDDEYDEVEENEWTEEAILLEWQDKC